MKHLPRTLKSKLYPAFIRNNESLAEAIEKLKKQERIWPKIGLDNSTTKIDKRRKLVFSGTGPQAMWDIATMSMRGISSCQGWRGSHRDKLVGSMADPFLAIMYVTSGIDSNHKGPRMSQRALVRFVIHRTTGQAALLLERIYPVGEGTHESAARLIKLFSNFLLKKTKNKYPVIQSGYGTIESYFIPLTDVVQTIHEEHRSYRDSHVPYYADSKKYPDVDATLLRLEAERYAQTEGSKIKNNLPPYGRIGNAHHSFFPTNFPSY